jgi:single-strand DNA-binding protein
MKGSPVFIEGRLELDTWETRNGEKRSKLRVVADNLQLLTKTGRKSNDDDDLDGVDGVETNEPEENR